MSLGAIINCTHGTKVKKANVKMHLNEQYFIEWENNPNSTADYRLVEIRAERDIVKGDELLFDYGKKFWADYKESCNECFKNDWDDSNPMILCSGKQKCYTNNKEYPCNIQYHQKCLPELLALGSEPQLAPEWFCSECNVNCISNHDNTEPIKRNLILKRKDNNGLKNRSISRMSTLSADGQDELNVINEVGEQKRAPFLTSQNSTENIPNTNRNNNNQHASSPNLTNISSNGNLNHHVASSTPVTPLKNNSNAKSPPLVQINSIANHRINQSSTPKGPNTTRPTIKFNNNSYAIPNTPNTPSTTRSLNSVKVIAFNTRTGQKRKLNVVEHTTTQSNVNLPITKNDTKCNVARSIQFNETKNDEVPSNHLHREKNSHHTSQPTVNNIQQTEELYNHAVTDDDDEFDEEEGSNKHTVNSNRLLSVSSSAITVPETISTVNNNSSSENSDSENSSSDTQKQRLNSAKRLRKFRRSQAKLEQQQKKETKRLLEQQKQEKIQSSQSETDIQQEPLSDENENQTTDENKKKKKRGGRRERQYKRVDEDVEKAILNGRTFPQLVKKRYEHFCSTSRHKTENTELCFCNKCENECNATVEKNRKRKSSNVYFSEDSTISSPSSGSSTSQQCNCADEDTLCYCRGTKAVLPVKCHAWCSVTALMYDYQSLKNCNSCLTNRHIFTNVPSKPAVHNVLQVYEDRVELQMSGEKKQTIFNVIHRFLDRQRSETRAEIIKEINEKRKDSEYDAIDNSEDYEQENILEELNNRVEATLETLTPAQIKCNYRGDELCLHCYCTLFGISHGSINNYFYECVHKRFVSAEHGSKGRIGRHSIEVERAKDILRDIIENSSQINPSETRSGHRTVAHLHANSVQELTDEINDIGKSQAGIAGCCISNSTVSRFIKTWNDNQDKELYVALSRNKNIASCNECNRLRNGIKKTINANAKQSWSKALKEHLAQAKAEREYYYSQINIASTTPDDIWVITMDGMDQNKSRIPHIALNKRAKVIDSGAKMKLHIRGILCVGGPIPSAAYICDESIPNDSDLTVTILHDFLRKSLAAPPLKIFRHTGEIIKQQSGESKENTNNFHAEPEIGCTDNTQFRPSINNSNQVCKDCEHDPDKCAVLTYPNRLPRRLHLQLDNCGKDNKNKTLIGYLALLVAQGYFESIKLGFEVVGHTHDKIDQVFSRFSVALNQNNAITMSELQKLLQKAYTSHIKVAKSQVASAVDDTDDELEHEDGPTTDNNNNTSSTSSSNEKRRKKETGINKFSTKVRKCTSAMPMIAQVIRVAAFRQFLDDDLGLGKILDDFQGIQNPHLMKITWNADYPTEVWLWPREYSNSHTNTMRPLPGRSLRSSHTETNTGLYEVGIKLLDETITQTLKTAGDPAYKSLLKVKHFKDILKTVDYCIKYSYGAKAFEGAPTEEIKEEDHREKKEWVEYEKRSDKQLKSTSCPECEPFQTQLSEIVIPSFLKTNTEEEKTKRKELLRDKNALTKQFLDHRKTHPDRFRGFFSKPLAAPTFGRNPDATAVKVRQAAIDQENNKRISAHNGINSNGKLKPSLFTSKRIRENEKSTYETQDWGAEIEPGMIIAIELDALKYPAYPVCLAIVMEVIVNPKSADNPYLKVVWFEPDRNNFDNKEDRKKVLEYCYQLHESMLLPEYNNDVKNVLSSGKLGQETINWLLESHVKRALKAGAFIDKEKKSKKKKKKNESKEDQLEEASQNLIFTPHEITNNMRTACASNSLHIPMAFGLAALYRWKQDLDPIWDVDEEGYTIFRVDEKGNKVPNQHITGPNKQYRPIIKTHDKQTQSDFLPNACYDTIEKSVCISWGQIKEVFKSEKEEDLELLSSGWPRRIFGLLMNKLFVQKIINSIEERAQDPLVEDGNDDNDNSVDEKQELDEEKDNNSNNNNNKRKQTSPESVTNEELNKKQRSNNSSQQERKRKLANSLASLATSNDEQLAKKSAIQPESPKDDNINDPGVKNRLRGLSHKDQVAIHMILETPNGQILTDLTNTDQHETADKDIAPEEQYIFRNNNNNHNNHNNNNNNNIRLGDYEETVRNALIIKESMEDGEIEQTEQLANNNNNNNASIQSESNDVEMEEKEETNNNTTNKDEIIISDNDDTPHDGIYPTYGYLSQIGWDSLSSLNQHLDDSVVACCCKYYYVQLHQNIRNNIYFFDPMFFKTIIQKTNQHTIVPTMELVYNVKTKSKLMKLNKVAYKSLWIIPVILQGHFWIYLLYFPILPNTANSSSKSLKGELAILDSLGLANYWGFNNDNILLVKKLVAMHFQIDIVQLDLIIVNQLNTCKELVKRQDDSYSCGIWTIYNLKCFLQSLIDNYNESDTTSRILPVEYPTLTKLLLLSCKPKFHDPDNNIMEYQKALAQRIAVDDNIGFEISWTPIENYNIDLIYNNNNNNNTNNNNASVQLENTDPDVEMDENKETNNNQASLRRSNRSDFCLVSNIEFNELLEPNSTITKQSFNEARIQEFGLEKRFISDEIGYGVYCTKTIPRSAIVAIFDGEEFTHAEAKIKDQEHAAAGRGSYMLWLPAAVTIQPANSNQKLISAIDPTTIDEKNWGLARYFNDAPNKTNSTERVANLKPQSRVSEDHQRLFVAMIAIRDIQAGEELLFDYGVENLAWRNKTGENKPMEE